MKRGRKIVLVSHCILNVNSKVEGLALYPAGMQDLFIALMQKGCGIIQLPCIELEACGLRRWGQVVEQLDHPHFRHLCRSRLEPVVLQVKAYLEQGYRISGVLGLDGSPTCAVSITCSGEWGGEIGELYGTNDKIDGLGSKKAPGVMMQILREMFEEEGIEVPFVGIDEGSEPVDILQTISRLDL